MSSPQQSKPMGNDTVVKEFTNLRESSLQLFHEIRELPQYGHQHWRNHYSRAFDVHTKLWKFQQQHRIHLEKSDKLHRWEIGEIASRIAQLYYHYYLRTSDPIYLKKSYTFYCAIRQRRYFHNSRQDANSATTSSVKKLRYFVRFLVVCVLLRQHETLYDVMNEMEKEISRYSTLSEQEEAQQWHGFLKELKDFLQCIHLVNIHHSNVEKLTDDLPDLQNVRALPLCKVPTRKANRVRMHLSEAVIVGSVQGQVKLGELTMDMYRMLLVLEREPNLDSNQNDLSSPAAIHSTSSAQHKLSVSSLESTITSSQSSDLFVSTNPHKYLLFNPTHSELLSFITASYKRLSPTGILLIYLSMDGNAAKPVNKSILTNDKDIANSTLSYDGYNVNGLLTNHSMTNLSPPPVQKKHSINAVKNPDCVYPGDLFCYTRCPLFLIVDSNYVTAFQKFPSFFGQPLVVFLAAATLPTTLSQAKFRGGLLTLFLHHPLIALCYICQVMEVDASLWEQLQQCFSRFNNDCFTYLSHSNTLPNAYDEFLQDAYLSAIICRFVFCNVVLRLHHGFHDDRFYPISQPDLGECSGIYHNINLQRCILEMAALLDSKSHFVTTDQLIPSSS